MPRLVCDMARLWGWLANKNLQQKKRHPFPDGAFEYRFRKPT
jgi:hypothetical protein